MHPTHHVHISTGFMFVCLLFIVSVIAIFAWLSWSKRQVMLRNLQIQQEHEERMGRCRRLAKDWEKSIASSTAWTLIASIRMLTRRTARHYQA